MIRGARPGISPSPKSPFLKNLRIVRPTYTGNPPVVCPTNKAGQMDYTILQQINQMHEAMWRFLHIFKEKLDDYILCSSYSPLVQ